MTNFRRELEDSAKGARFNRVAEPSGEAHRPHHAQLVFFEALLGAADGADDAGAEIRAAADEIEHLIRLGIEQEGIDCKVATLDVFFGGLGVDHLVGVAAVRVAHVGAERRDFHLNRFLSWVGHFSRICRDDDYPKLRSDGQTAGEKLLDAIRRGVGGYVIVDRLAAEENVAHATADEVCLVTGGAQGSADVLRKLAGAIHGLRSPLTG